MDNIQQKQEDEYAFPYHYLPKIGEKGFSQSENLFWGYIYLSYIEHVLIRIRDIPALTSILDVGCGDGRLLVEARKILPDTALVGIDYSERALSFARAFAFEKKIEFKCVDINNAPELGLFSLITLIEVCEHIPPVDLPVFLKNCFTHLNPKGYLLITVPSTLHQTSHKHYQHFSEKSLRQLVEEYGVVEKVEFLTKVGLVPQIIQRILSNRFFVLNQPYLQNVLYNFYKKNFTLATSATGDRILMILQKK